MSFRSAEQGNVFFSSPDHTGTSVYVGDKLLHVSSIADMVRTLVGRIQEQLDELLYHQKAFTIDGDAPIYDSPRDMTDGYTFLDDPRNGWKDKLVLRYMLEHPDIRLQYAQIVIGEDGKKSLDFKRHELRKLRKRIFDVQKDLIVAIMLSYGAPARGTELASHTLRNVAGGSIRNFFFNFGTAFFRAGYNKTSSLTGEDVTVARAATLEVSEQFLRFLVFLRPLYTTIQGILLPQMRWDSQYKLFAGLTSPIESSDLGLMLERKSLEIMGIRLKMSVHRQFMAYLANHHYEAFPRQSGGSMAGAQLGHSSNVDRQYYGLDTSLPPNTDYHGLRNCLITSGVFHQILGLGSGLLDSIYRETSAMLHLPRRHAHSQAHASHLEASHLADIAMAVSNSLRPSLINNIQRIVQESHAAVVHVFQPGQISADSTQLADDFGVYPSPVLLKHLRHFFGDLNSSLGFRDHNQAIATQLAVDRQQSFLVVTRTGSGKTLPGILASRYVDPKALVTVYILPYVAMHQELHQRLQGCGMSSRSWKVDSGITPENCPQNVIVTCESAVMPQFVEFLKAIAQLKKLARVIVDEVHLILLQQDFREAMLQLHFLGVLGVQVMLLTATLPVALQGQLFKHVGITAPLVLRADTSRANISYRVDRVATREQVCERVVQIVERLLKEPSAGKILIFCRRVAETTQYAKKLNIEACYAKLGEDKIAQILGNFRSGSVKAIAATSVLGVGLDVPGVTHVIHSGNPSNIMEFSQDTGRAGRDSATKKGYSIIVSEPLISARSDMEDTGEASMRAYIVNDKTCRRLPMHRSLDGKARSCAMLGPETQLCDVCEREIDLRTSIIPPPTAQEMGLTCGERRPQLQEVPNLGPIAHIASTHAAIAQRQETPHSALHRTVLKIMEQFSHSCVVCKIQGKHTKITKPWSVLGLSTRMRRPSKGLSFKT